MGFYIYKHYDENNNIIYIGQTKNMEQRQNKHKRNSKWKDSIFKITYSKIYDGLLMNLYEKYYISKYTPINNKKDIDCNYYNLFETMYIWRFSNLNVRRFVWCKFNIH